ncbi:MAG: MCE family protein [Acetobacteraceae bacterium]|nr:MCE family protein [Acetobacteraceae bacterium]
MKLSLHTDMEGHLGPGTQFWIGGKTISVTDLSGLQSLIAGPYIGIDPHPGPKQNSYVGLANEPVLKWGAEGTEYILHADDLASVSRGAPIYYLHMQVGQVKDYKLLEDGHSVDIYAFVIAPYDKLVRRGSRFWKSGAVHFSTGPNGPELQVQSVAALFQGAVAFETPPGPADGVLANADEVFKLYDGPEAARFAPGPAAASFKVVFDKPGAVQAGAPVTLMGLRVGTVEAAALRYDPQSGALSTEAMVAIEPRQVKLASPEGWGPDPERELVAMMDRLVREGLRAELGKSVPLIGGTEIALRFLPNAPPASLITGTPPEIPAASGTDIEQIIASANNVVAKIDEMPLRQIAADIREATDRLSKLAQSPEVTQSLRHLDQSMASLQQIARDAEVQIPPLLDKLRQTATESEVTLASARRLLAQTQSPSAPQTAGLPEALFELARAARAIRELSDYLDRHPEALLRGRASQ